MKKAFDSARRFLSIFGLELHAQGNGYGVRARYACIERKGATSVEGAVDAGLKMIGFDVEHPNKAILSAQRDIAGEWYMRTQEHFAKVEIPDTPAGTIARIAMGDYLHALRQIEVRAIEHLNAIK